MGKAFAALLATALVALMMVGAAAAQNVPGGPDAPPPSAVPDPPPAPAPTPAPAPAPAPVAPAPEPEPEIAPEPEVDPEAEAEEEAEAERRREAAEAARRRAEARRRAAEARRERAEAAAAATRIIGQADLAVSQAEAGLDLATGIDLTAPATVPPAQAEANEEGGSSPIRIVLLVALLLVAVAAGVMAFLGRKMPPESVFNRPEIGLVAMSSIAGALIVWFAA